MDFTQDIKHFITETIGGTYITKELSHEIVFADSFLVNICGQELLGKNALDVLPWEPRIAHLKLSHGKAYDWEYIDKELKTHWSFKYSLFDKDGVTYKIGHMTDTTGYMLLSRDVIEYSSFFEKLSNFQSAMLKHISSNCFSLFPIITSNFRIPRLYFLMARGDSIEITTYDLFTDTFSTYRMANDLNLSNIFSLTPFTELTEDDLDEGFRKIVLANGGDALNRYTSLPPGTISDKRYIIYLEMDNNTDRKMLDVNICNTIMTLCLENSLMREEIVYESEHDKLTGLYNKGKYLARLEEYGCLDSVGILNFDVNYLKQTNDIYGHEAGDQLLVKAANSIREVTSENIHSYRMGGDEFLMIACNCKKEDITALKKRWESALEEINKENNKTPCVMALGTAFGEKKYNIAELMKIADQRMYEDKRLKKKPSEEIR